MENVIEKEQSLNDQSDIIYEKQFQFNSITPSNRQSYYKEGEYNFDQNKKIISRKQSTKTRDSLLKPIISSIQETCQNFFTQSQIILQDYDESLTRFQKIFETKQLKFEEDSLEIIDTYQEALKGMATYEKLEAGAIVQDVPQHPEIDEALQDFQKQQDLIEQKVAETQTHEEKQKKFINFIALKCDLLISLENLKQKIQQKTVLEDPMTNKIVDFTLRILQTKCQSLEKEIQLAGLIWQAMKKHKASTSNIMNEMTQLQVEAEQIINDSQLQEQLYIANQIITNQLKYITCIEDSNQERIDEEDSQSDNDSVNNENQDQGMKSAQCECTEKQELQFAKTTEENQIAEQTEAQPENQTLFQKFMDEYCNKMGELQQAQEQTLQKQNESTQNFDQLQKDLDVYKAEIKQINNIYEKYKNITTEILNSADQNKQKVLGDVGEAMKFFSTSQELQKTTETWFEKMSQGIAAQIKQNLEQEQKLSNSMVEPEHSKDTEIINQQQQLTQRPVSRARKNLLCSLSLSQNFETKNDYEVQILEIFSSQFNRSQEFKNLQNVLHDTWTAMNKLGQMTIVVMTDDVKKTLSGLDYNNKIQKIEKQVNRVLQQPFSLNQISDIQDIISQSLNQKIEKSFKNKIQLLNQFKILMTTFQTRPLIQEYSQFLQEYENNVLTLKTLIQKITKSLK